MGFRDLDGGWHTNITVESLEDLRDFVMPTYGDVYVDDVVMYKPVVYIAGPYTNGDPVLNTRNAIQAADILHSQGYTPIVPHLSMLWHTISPKDYDWWMDYDYELIKLCEVMVRLPGESEGADLEAKFWREGPGLWRAFVYVEEI